MIKMNERQLIGKEKVMMPPYSCWTKNCIVQGGGGIATAISKWFKDFAMRAREGINDDEYLIMRLEFSPQL